MNHGQIAFPDLPFLEIPSDCSGSPAISCKDKDPGGGLVKAMDDVNLFLDLITKNFHGDKITGPWVIRRMNQNAGRFVDRDKPLVSKKNREGSHFESG